ncbi:MAG: SiaB family protein kinase [Bacteroidales bacterium]|nr:SiaB family protein kinase [Bacteroidales bacterium]
MKNKNIILSFKGEITSEIISMVLDVAENKLDAANEKGIIKKKIFNILVECLQNLYHHTEKGLIKNENTKSSLILIWYENEYYNILTGNYIRNKNIPPIQKRLETINSLSKDELRDWYRKILNNSEISAKGGANLGMIDVARKSGEKIEYNFKKINSSVSFYEFKIKVKK